MKSEICDYDEKNVTVCWMIDAGRTMIHFTSNLSELLSLRKCADEMISNLEKIQAKLNQEHNEKTGGIKK